MKEKNTRASKKKKAGAAAGVLVLAGLLALALNSGSFGIGFGGGSGVGFGSGDAASAANAAPDAAASAPSSDAASAPSAPSTPSASAPDEASAGTPVSVIRIEGNQIFFDDTLCADENELRDLIMPLGAERTYEFYYGDAIKGTYDRVRTVLTELTEALDLTITEP